MARKNISTIHRDTSVSALWFKISHRRRQQVAVSGLDRRERIGRGTPPHTAVAGRRGATRGEVMVMCRVAAVRARHDTGAGRGRRKRWPGWWVGGCYTRGPANRARDAHETVRLDRGRLGQPGRAGPRATRPFQFLAGCVNQTTGPQPFYPQ